ncbi:MAG: hypothetical protein ACI8Y7_000917 [Candidatus Woesearchaeota archaeon]|jgi:hypothetical protein
MSYLPEFSIFSIIRMFIFVSVTIMIFFFLAQAHVVEYSDGEVRGHILAERVTNAIDGTEYAKFDDTVLSQLIKHDDVITPFGLELAVYNDNLRKVAKQKYLYVQKEKYELYLPVVRIKKSTYQQVTVRRIVDFTDISEPVVLHFNFIFKR